MQGGDTMAMLNSLLPFFLMGGIFYFMLWRPQKKEQKRNLVHQVGTTTWLLMQKQKKQD